MRSLALLPLGCAIVAVVLGFLCIFAGHKRGFMEDYDILTLNTSTLGHNLFNSSSSSTSSSPTATSASILSTLSGLAHNVSDSVLSSIEDELNNITAPLADELAKELGIKQWYSFHLMDLCEGTYAPNASEKGAGENVTNCTKAHAFYHFNITSHLSSELSLGSHHLNLTSLSWPSSLQSKLNDLATALDALFILYIIGISSAFLLLLTSLLTFLLSSPPSSSLSHSPLPALLNFFLATISFLAFLIASTIITIVQKKAAHVFNKYGNEIGVYAYRGKKCLVITWVAVGFMGFAGLVWVVEWALGRRRRGLEYREKGRGGLFGGKGVDRGFEGGDGEGSEKL